MQSFTAFAAVVGVILPAVTLPSVSSLHFASASICAILFRRRSSVIALTMSRCRGNPARRPLSPIFPRQWLKTGGMP